MSAENDEHDQPLCAAAASPNAPLRTDRRLLEILVCPVSRGPLEYVSSRNLLISRSAGVAYPIREGIPIMILDEAIPLDVVESTRS